MDGFADQMEEKLNLTAGERTDEDDLDPEMDKHFKSLCKSPSKTLKAGLQ